MDARRGGPRGRLACRTSPGVSGRPAWDFRPDRSARSARDRSTSVKGPAPGANPGPPGAAGVGDNGADPTGSRPPQTRPPGCPGALPVGTGRRPGAPAGAVAEPRSPLAMRGALAARSFRALFVHRVRGRSLRLSPWTGSPITSRVLPSTTTERAEPADNETPHRVQSAAPTTAIGGRRLTPYGGPVRKPRTASRSAAVASAPPPLACPASPGSSTWQAPRMASLAKRALCSSGLRRWWCDRQESNLRRGLRRAA
jgi:hypothetical protein